MKEENIKIQDNCNIDINEDEEYKDLPEFLKSIIGNIYNSSSQKSSNSKEQTKNINSNKYNNSLKIKKFAPTSSETRNYKENGINFGDGNIKIFNIKDSNLSIMKKSLKLRSILSDNQADYMSNIKECSICFRVIINYGLLSNCDDIFCYECIKQWRNEAKSKSKREMFRRCPICNCESPLLIKSKVYLTGEEKKQKMIEYRQESNNL
jgi:hypothetical protein